MPADVFALLADPTRRRLVEVLHDGERSVNDLVAAVRVAQPGVSRHGFDGIIVHCEVLECEPPSRLAYSWSAGPIVNTQVSYRLEPDGDGTRVFFEHSGFDMSQPWGQQAFRGAEFGWVKMLERLPGVVTGLARREGG